MKMSHQAIESQGCSERALRVSAENPAICLVWGPRQDPYTASLKDGASCWHQQCVVGKFTVLFITVRSIGGFPACQPNSAIGFLVLGRISCMLHLPSKDFRELSVLLGETLADVFSLWPPTIVSQPGKLGKAFRAAQHALEPSSNHVLSQWRSKLRYHRLYDCHSSTATPLSQNMRYLICLRNASWPYPTLLSLGLSLPEQCTLEVGTVPA